MKLGTKPSGGSYESNDGWLNDGWNGVGGHIGADYSNSFNSSPM
jgi:hypothetical protein